MIEGVRYLAEVPDTLELAGGAALAINGLGGTLDPGLDCLPNGQVHFDVEAPVMQHWAPADLGCGAKVDESFPLMRLMSGSRQHLDREDGLHQNLMARVRDGLFWDFVDARRPWRNIYGDSDRRYGPGRDEDFCIPSYAVRMMASRRPFRARAGERPARRRARRRASRDR